MTDTHRAALDEALDRLRSAGRLPGDDLVDRQALRRAAASRADGLDLDLAAYLTRVAADPDEEGRLVEALLGPGDEPPVAEVVHQLEEATDELESANADRKAIADDLAAIGGQLDAAATELDSVTAQLEVRSRDVERLSAIVDGLVDVHPAPAAVIDPSLVVRAWSSALCDLTGVPGEDAIGRRLGKVSHLFPQSTVGIALRSLVNDAPTRATVSTEVGWQEGALVVAGTAVLDGDDVVAVLVTVSPPA